MGFRRPVTLLLAAMAVIYAGVAAYRTVVDTDIGWQMATGRELLEHGRLLKHDVFSYTAQGNEWIYPPFSGVAFFLAWKAGGFAALTWLGVGCAAGTMLLLVWHARPATAALAVVAAPLIAVRSLPRAGMFSTILFAAVFCILWRHYRERPAAGQPRRWRPLWLLPILFAAWANLHLGFVAGLAAMAAYIVLEALRKFEDRLEAGATEASATNIARLRGAAPWLVAAALATLVNPWGPWLYAALARQAEVMETHREALPEWSGTPLSLDVVRQALDWRDPQSGFWWLILAGILGCGAGLARRQFGPAVLLAGAGALALYAYRFQVLFAIVAVVVAGALLDDLFEHAKVRRSLARAAMVAAGVVFVALTAMRIGDLASNRHYFERGEIAVFGAGPSRWYPERAVEYLWRERPPGRLWNDYNFGGYLIWTAWPGYPVYIDGRAIPFGAELFGTSRAVAAQAPEGEVWSREVQRWDIRAVLFSVARLGGSGARLARFCGSDEWRLAWLDETAALFVARREGDSWLETHPPLGCSSARIEAPQGLSRGELYNFHANKGYVMQALGRHTEAMEALQQAEAIFSRDPNLHVLKGQVWQAVGRHAEAEKEYRAALALRDEAGRRLAIGMALAAQGKLDEAAVEIERAARGHSGWTAWRELGEVYLAKNQPREALSAFDRAAAAATESGTTEEIARGFHVELAMGRAHAWFRLGEVARAIQQQERAVKLAGDEPARWLELAELYDSAGRTEDARKARERAGNQRISTRRSP